MSNSIENLIKELNLSQDEWNLYKDTIAKIESNGIYDIKGGYNDHYDGRYQLGKDAKTDAARILKIDDPGHTKEARESFRKDKNLQEQMLVGFTIANHRYLNKKSQKYKDLSTQEKLEALAYAHNQGMGGAKKWLDTGKVGKDGFNTSGTKYSDAIRLAFQNNQEGETPDLSGTFPEESISTGLDINTLASPTVEDTPISDQETKPSFWDKLTGTAYAQPVSLASLGLEPEKSETISLADLGLEAETPTPETPQGTVLSDQEIADLAEQAPTEPKTGGYDSSFLPNFETPGEKAPSKSSASFVAGLADVGSLGLAAPIRGGGAWLGLVDTEAPAFTGEAFLEGRKQYNQALDQIKEENEAGFMAGQLVGSIIPGSAIAKVSNFAKRGKLATDTGKAAVAGAIEGGLYEGGKSRGEDLAEVAGDALVGASVGAAAGAGVSAFMKGAGALLGKMPDSDKALLVKESLKDNNSIDVALRNAERTAERSAESNLQQITLLNKIVNEGTTKKRAIQKKVINLLDARGTPNQALGDWKKFHTEANMNPRQYLQYSNNKVQERTKKIAKKFNVNAEDLQSYFNWRHDMYNYIKFVNSSAKRFDKKAIHFGDTAPTNAFKTKKKPTTKLSWEATTPKDKFREELKTFKANIDSKLASPESYNEFKMRQYLTDAMYDIQKAKFMDHLSTEDVIDDKLTAAVDKMVKQNYAKDPTRNWFFRKGAAAHNVAEVVDKKAGTNMTGLNYDLYEAEKMASGFKTQVYDLAEDLKDLRRTRHYGRMSDEQLVANIEKGVDGPLENSFREVYRRIRELANENGVNIREFRKGQKYYVPMKRKSGAEYIKALEDKFEELEPVMKDMNPKILARIFRDENYANSFKIPEMDDSVKDIIDLKKLLSQSSNIQVESPEMMRKAVKNLRSEESIKEVLDPTVRAVHERHGDIPTWAREHSLEKMLFLDAQNISDLIYKRPVLDKLDTQIFLLKQKGFETAAKYFNDLKFDIMGIPREATKRRQYVSILKELTLSDYKLGKAYLGLENAFVTALYPNYLGLNLRAVVRNLTQPYTMTTRELGMGLKGDVMALNATRKILAEGLSKAQKRFNKLGLIDVRDPKLQDLEGVRSGLANYFKEQRWARWADKGINTFADAAMYAYTKTDTINRLITAQMSEDIAKAVADGSTKWLSKAPIPVKNKIQDIIDRGSDVDELTKEIGKWLQVKTQLNYSKDDMYEFGREMGPLFSMLSKWPTAVAGDVAARVMMQGKAGALGAAQKYLFPLALAHVAKGVVDMAVDPKSAQYREIFGYGGLPSWLPGPSAGGITDAFLPIPVVSALEQTGGLIGLTGKALEGGWEDRDTAALKSTIQRTTEQFVPVAGGVLRSKRHMEGLLGTTDKEKEREKKLKKLRKVLKD